ncbi:hypothetical protein [Pontibacter anaerobius]|uniref:Uncharacterized protein n=1 Tax=Pontibacter anaerobius TaxID=2993940 RepID=A0ABT3RL39_9BACT|nr:hypothetical protein [Pontibacter anaerobius]MCX2741910.1 hypothetical protein [Pontibacter anaerobius]
MRRTSTSVISVLNRIAFLLLFLFFVAACSAHVEREADKKQQDATVAVVTSKKVPSVTVASYENQSDEVYFDLIANTSNCLGEDLWFGGKLESQNKAMLANSGAFSQQKVYIVTELTATGLNSNNSYKVDNKSHTLRAVVDKDGVIFLQLSQGQLQLVPQANADPLVLAYQPNPTSGYYDGSVGRWSCK